MLANDFFAFSARGKVFLKTLLLTFSNWIFHLDYDTPRFTKLWTFLIVALQSHNLDL